MGTAADDVPNLRPLYDSLQPIDITFVIGEVGDTSERAPPCASRRVGLGPR
jgi:hypothetical protein